VLRTGLRIGYMGLKHAVGERMEYWGHKHPAAVVVCFPNFSSNHVYAL